MEILRPIRPLVLFLLLVSVAAISYGSRNFNPNSDGDNGKGITPDLRIVLDGNGGNYEVSQPTISWTYCVQYSSSETVKGTLHDTRMPSAMVLNVPACLIEIIGWLDGKVTWRRKE
jgi:hypothetical protein